MGLDVIRDNQTIIVLCIETHNTEMHLIATKFLH